MTQRIDEVIIDALVRHMAMSDPYCRFEVGDETQSPREVDDETL
ncbi:MAG: hypothetical protein WCA79_11520 [Anaerolineales bacterium]